MVGEIDKLQVDRNKHATDSSPLNTATPTDADVLYDQRRAEFEALLDDYLPEDLRRGTETEVTVIAKGPNGILVEAEGLTKGPMLLPRGQEDGDGFGQQIGDQLTVYITKSDGPDAVPLVSESKPLDRLSRREIYCQFIKSVTIGQEVAGDVVFITDNDSVLVQFADGTTGVIFKSQLSTDPNFDPRQLLGTQITSVITALDPRADGPRLSPINAEKTKVLEQLNIGDVIEVKVLHVAQHGVMVLYSGVQGFIHKSRLSLEFVNDPRDPVCVVKEGDIFNAQVLETDIHKRGFRLSRNDILPNPWPTADQDYRPEEHIGGTIVAEIVTDSSAGWLVRIVEGLRGWIDKSKISSDARIGDHIEVTIGSIDSKRNKMRLYDGKIIPKATNEDDEIGDS